MDDTRLLQAYVRDHDQAAFTALVHRHADLVYSAALRRMNGDPHSAQEVTQGVFIRLARQASALTTHPALPAWLHLCTRHAAIDLQRAHARRRRHETVLKRGPEKGSIRYIVTSGLMRPVGGLT
jgi:DNA-directed RNA polymerase specialized sigma24 family protein